MSTTEQKTQSTVKDIYGVYQQNIDKLFDGIRQQVPRYHQSVTNVQQEYLQAVENIFNSSVALQKEFARKAGITTNVPEAALKVVRDTTEELVKASTIQNQIALATIDAAQQNIKTFNDNAKAFADLNKNILQSCLSAFTNRNN
ncbi:MAG: hypothetical protein NPMRTHETA2_990009 [Nitrosopumilales archaeon]|nr:MAG: hypothetical protein NPMRTHETA2_990009 [Nitrosopumilales archaeon]